MGKFRSKESNKKRSEKSSKLTSFQASEIRRLYSSGEFTQVQLSKMFNISSNSISNIIKFKTYRF